MKSALLLLGFALLRLAAAGQQNTLVIIADDMGTDYCGFYEDAGDTAKMPNVRTLLARGVRFQNFWATPYCSPSRACLSTGRYPFRHGVGTVIAGAGSAQLDTAEMTLAKLLHNFAPTRYATAHVGKWHLNVQTPQSVFYPTRNFGYDLFAGNFQGAITNYYNWSKITNGVTRTITNYATTETVNDAIAWLDTIGNQKPFFLWLAFNAPHSPLHKPPDSLHTVPGLTGTTQHINQNPRLYFRAMIEAMDTEIGRLLRRLAATGRLDNTNIIFVGDNGNAPNTRQNPADSARVKGSLYEGGIHTPLIIAGPAVRQPGRASPALVNFVDIFATILETSGFDRWADYIPAAKRPVDAKSLVPLLTNQAAAVRDWGFSEQFARVTAPEDGKTIRNDTYKLIRFDSGNQEFYNLASDPRESGNLLKGKLSAVEQSNYNYLCTELGKLTGSSPCLTTGTADEDFAGVRAYPSPFTTEIRIESPDALSYALSDSQGRVVRRGRAAGSFTLEAAALPAGLYVLKVEAGAGWKIWKLVKE